MKVSHLTVIKKDGTTDTHDEVEGSIEDLHLIYRDGFAVVNYLQGSAGQRMGVSYPACDIREIISVV